MLTDDDKGWIESSISKGIVEALNELVIPQFVKIDKRFENVEQRLDTLDERVENLESLTDQILRTSGKTQDQLDNHAARILQLETAKV